MDGGCKVEGYSSDISRTFVLGKASDKMKSVFEIVHRAQSAALATARPGIECQAVDAAARKVIGDAGFGPDYKFFTHRVGHGIGMDGHEWPYLVRGNNTVLAPNMTFSDEPGIFTTALVVCRLRQSNTSFSFFNDSKRDCAAFFTLHQVKTRTLHRRQRALGRRAAHIDQSNNEKLWRRSVCSGSSPKQSISGAAEIKAAVSCTWHGSD